MESIWVSGLACGDVEDIWVNAIRLKCAWRCCMPFLRRRVLSRRGASELELSQKRSAADFLKRGDSCSEVPL